MAENTMYVTVRAHTLWARFIIRAASRLLPAHHTLAWLWLRSVGRCCVIALRVEGHYHRFGPRRLLRVPAWSFIRIRFDEHLDPIAEGV